MPYKGLIMLVLLDGVKAQEFSTLKSIPSEKRSNEQRDKFTSLANENNTLVQRKNAEAIKRFKQIILQSAPDKDDKVAADKGIGRKLAIIAGKLYEISKEDKAIRANTLSRINATVKMMHDDKQTMADGVGYYSELCKAAVECADIPECEAAIQRLFGVKSTSSADQNAVNTWAKSD